MVEGSRRVIRTAFFAAAATMHGLLWAAGGDDILATQFHLSINGTTYTYTMRVAVLVGPVLAFVVARRWSLSLQRSDQERLHHGRGTGVIDRSIDGGYAEQHAPLDQARTQVFSLATGFRSPSCGPRPMPRA